MVIINNMHMELRPHEKRDTEIVQSRKKLEESQQQLEQKDQQLEQQQKM